MFSFPRSSLGLALSSSSLISRVHVECSIKLAISSCSVSTWISKFHDLFEAGPLACFESGVLKVPLRAAAIEKGARGALRFANDGALMGVRAPRLRRKKALAIFDFGDRPAGALIGADFGLGMDVT
jgi:hypothetical protein